MARNITNSQTHQDLIKRIVISGSETRKLLTTFISPGRGLAPKEPEKIYDIQQIFSFRLRLLVIGEVIGKEIIG